MNILLKASTIAALLLIIGGTTSQTYGQRCGGDFVYWVRDQNGDLIDDKNKLEMKYVRSNPTTGGEVTKVSEELLGLVNLVKHAIDENVVTPDERTEWMKVLRIQTHCGLRFAEVALEYENHKMVLRFHNMPPETNFFLDSLPFQDGTFEIDFQSDMSLKSVKLNREGLRGKEGKYFHRGVAKTQLLVAAENWNKIARP